MRVRPRQNGKTRDWWAETLEMVESGQHLHVVSKEGPTRCYNGDCSQLIRGFAKDLRNPPTGEPHVKNAHCLLVGCNGPWIEAKK